MKTKTVDNKFWLLALYVAIVCSIVLRSYVESTHFVTPDSEFYLRVAENINNGKGIIAPDVYPFDEQTPEVHFAVWPIGYPAMIALISKFSGLSLLVSSKVVNLIFLGLIFYLFHHWFKKDAWFPALYFFSYAKMEVFSYTWSEGAFLFFILLLCYWLSNLEKKFLFVKVVFCLIALFLLRYAGVIFFLYVGVFGIYQWYIGNKKKALVLVLSVCVAGVPCLLYLWNNQMNNGYYSGLDRFTPDEMSNWFAIKSSIVGLGNEFLFVSHYFVLKNNLTWIFILFTSLQFVLYVRLWRSRKLILQPLFNQASWIMVSMSIGYLVFVGVLQRLHACSYFDYRILAPFSTLFFVAVFGSISKSQQPDFFEKNKTWILGFMLICYVMSLPKMFLVDLLF